jgi:hypothetical protein
MGFFDLSYRKRHYVMESTYGIAVLSLLQCRNPRYGDVARILVSVFLSLAQVEYIFARNGSLPIAAFH